MAKVKVETLGAVIDRNPIGSTIEIDESHAKQLADKGIVKILPKPKVKKESAPKKPTTKKKDTTEETKK